MSKTGFIVTMSFDDTTATITIRRDTPITAAMLLEDLETLTEMILEDGEIEQNLTDS